MKRQSISMFSLVLAGSLALAGCATQQAESTVVEGEADGFGGPIKATVTLTEDKITGLELVGEGETPAVGGEALKTLQESIVKAGTIEGVDGVSGATWTSNGVFAAIKNAMGLETEEEAEKETEAVTASGLKHGVAIIGTPRLGPGADDKEVPVYSFNEVMAYVILDGEDRIVDCEVDVLEVITPNHDSAEDNMMAGWPGASYTADLDGDGTTETTLDETEDYFTESISSWETKRMKGSGYKMNSGTWADEMDIYEEFFKGKTVDEIKAWAAASCSDLNGRPIHGVNEKTKDEDKAKYEGFTDEQKAELDSISGATMSLSDAHGDIIGAIEKAALMAVPMKADKDIAKVGLGITVTPRLGPGTDDQEVPVYSYNTQAVGACYDADGNIVDVYMDVLEVITPNHDGAEDNYLVGWPGQSYNRDEDADGTVDCVLEQTEDTFMEQVNNFKSKKALGDAYKMNSGTWTQEANIYESYFAGKSVEDIKAFVAACFSDLNGRPIHEVSEKTKDEDKAKYEGFTDEQKAELDAISGATMSMTDAHGNLLAALEASYNSAKAVEIKVN